MKSSDFILLFPGAMFRKEINLGAMIGGNGAPPPEFSTSLRKRDDSDSRVVVMMKSFFLYQKFHFPHSLKSRDFEQKK